jgi:DNA-binding GntR family transcriptional regulator
MRTSHRYHRRILEAFQTGDRAMAALLYSRSIDIALSELLATLGEERKPHSDA